MSHDACSSDEDLVPVFLFKRSLDVFPEVGVIASKGKATALVMKRSKTINVVPIIT